MQSDSPLGKPTSYPSRYTPGLLCPIARAANRAALGIGPELPFRGADIWNAWELTWLSDGGLPQVAVAEIRIPAESPNIVESKSLKLYLNSFSMSRFESRERVAELIDRDLRRCVDTQVSVRLDPVRGTPRLPIQALAGACLDDVDIDCDTYDVDPNLLVADRSETATETLHSHLLHSQCPVTSQPDVGSVLIEYRGPRIDHASLLRYIVSFRNHRDFHEACVERMFVDIMRHCAPERLSVYARYQRRGGIDINPFRSTADVTPENLRLWRQ